VNENDPFLYGEKLKASLIRGAKRIKSARTYPNIYVGWGTLCVENSIR
jgi:minor extracellular serine protease Vpr